MIKIKKIGQENFYTQPNRIAIEYEGDLDFNTFIQDIVLLMYKNDLNKGEENNGK